MKRTKRRTGEWDAEIKELAAFFKGRKPLKKAIRLNYCTVVADYTLFVESHMATVKAHSGEAVYLPYLVRLREMKEVFEREDV